MAEIKIHEDLSESETTLSETSSYTESTMSNESSESVHIQPIVPPVFQPIPPPRKSIEKLDAPDKSAVELTIEALISKIDKMEKDHQLGYHSKKLVINVKIHSIPCEKLLLAELAKQKEQNMVKEQTIREVSVLERKIKLQRKHTIKIIKKSMQEPDSEVKFSLSQTLL